MARVQSLLLMLCTAGTVAGSLLPGGGHQHGDTHNSVDPSGGVFIKPDELPQRPPPGRLPQLYQPPSTSGSAQIAVEPADQFTQLPSSSSSGLGGSSVPNFAEPDFGGWIPMTSSPDHQSQSQSVEENLISFSPVISQQPSVTGFAQGPASLGQQSQNHPQAGNGDSGFSFVQGSSPASTQEELLTNAWSQASTGQVGGGPSVLPASHVPLSPASEASTSFSQGGFVSTDLKPLNLPQSGQSSQASAQAFGGNTNTLSSFSSPSEVGNSFIQAQSIPTSLKPLGLPQPGGAPSQFLSPNEGDNTDPSFSSNAQLSGGGVIFSQASVTVGASSQAQTSPGGEDTSLPSSYVPPASQGGGALAQGAQVPTNLKPLDLPQTEGFSQSSFQSGDGGSLPSSTDVNNSLSQEGQVPIELKPLGLPQPARLPSQFPSQASTVGGSSLPSSYVPPPSGNTESLLSTPEGSVPTQAQPVQTFLKPLDLPQAEIQQPVETFLKPLDLPQTEPVETFLKPLDLPPADIQQPVQAALKPLDLPPAEPVQTFLKPLDLPPAEVQQPVETFLKPLDLPQTEPAQTFLKPLDQPPAEVQQSIDTFLKPLDLPQPEPAQTFLKPLDLPPTDVQQPVETSLKPLNLPQAEVQQPVETFLKPLDLPQIGGPPFQQTLQANIEPLAPSYVPPSGGDSFPQAGPAPAGLQPLDLPQAGGLPLQPSSQALPDITVQEEPPAPTVLKPLGLSQTEQSSSSQPESPLAGGHFGNPVPQYRSLSLNGDSFPQSGSVLSESELAAVSSSGSSSQIVAGGSSSSYSPSTQGAGSSQVATSSGQSSSQFTPPQTGGYTEPPAASHQTVSNAGGFPAPQSIDVPPEQAFIQSAFQTVEPAEIDQSSSPFTPEYVDSKPTFLALAPSNNEPFSPQGALQVTTSSSQSQSFPGADGAAVPFGPSGLSTVSAASVTDGGGALSLSVTSEPAYQPDIALGAAASGEVGSSVPFPQPPVQSEPLVLLEQSLVGGSPNEVGFESPEPPPSLVIDEQFLTSPSSGSSVVSPPGTPVVGSGGNIGGSFGGGNVVSSIGSGGNSFGTGTGSGSGSSAISSEAGSVISGTGSTIAVSGSGGAGISGGLDSDLASISSTVSTVSSSSNTGSGDPVEILSQTFTINDNGSYEYSYEQSDGQAAQETGQFTAGNEPETGSLVSTGRYRYRGTDGRQYSVEYTADERGFLPTGDHLPTPPAQIAAYAELRERYPALFWAERLRVQDPEKQT